MEKFLEKIGLSPSESKIYLCLLKYGELKTSEILSKTELNSGRIYDILGNMQKKGFVSSIIRNNVKYFTAAPPEILEEYIDEKEKEVRKQTELVKSKLPELKKIYKQNQNDPSVEVYLGKKGAKSAYQILLQNAKKGDTHYVIGITKQAFYAPWLINLLKTHIYPERIRKGLKVRKLMNTEAKKEALWKNDKSEIRYLPWNILSSYEVLGDVVMIQIFQNELICLVIKNKQTAQDYKEQFELLWGMAKK